MKTFVQYVIILIVLLFSCVKAAHSQSTQTISVDVDIDGVITTYTTTSSSSFTVTVDDLIIDGKKVSFSNAKNISITINGNVGKCETMSGNINIEGSVVNAETMSGNITAESIQEASNMSGDIYTKKIEKGVKIEKQGKIYLVE